MARLGDIATYVNGFAFKPSDWSNTGLPIIRIQDLTGNAYQANRYNGKYDKKYEVNYGDILISWSASLGVYVWTGEKAVLNQHIFKVVFDKAEVDKSFFTHQVQNILENAASQAHGATMKHLTKPVFDALPFNLPPMNEQQRIAAVLDKLSDLISLRKQQLAKLDELVKARFVEMFDERYPLFKIGDKLNTTSGGTPSRANSEFYEDGTIPWLTSGEVNTGTIYAVKNYITQKGMDHSSAKWIPENSVVVAMYGATAGQVGLLRIKTTTNQAVCSILPDPAYMPEYLYYAIKSKKTWMIAQCAGGAQPNISQSIIKKMQIIDAPLNVQRQFAVFIGQIEKSKLTIQQSLDKLELLKKSLMQEYFG